MEQIKEQKKELLERIKRSTDSVRIMLLSFFVLALILKLHFGINFSLQLFILIIAWFILSFPFFYLTKKVKTTQEANNIHLYWIICELFLLTAIVHYIGGITWIGPFFYLFFPIYESFLFAKKQRVVMFVLTVSSYVSLAFLEYFKIIPYYEIFSGLTPYKIPEYFVPTVMAGTGALIFAFVAVSIFRDELEKKIEQIFHAYKETEEIKNTLAIRVKAKTKELKELNQTLEEQIKNKTKELRQRIEEMEKFHKITVGRELKMIELKKEIKKLKERLRG